jgi:hypothetical protein
VGTAIRFFFGVFKGRGSCGEFPCGPSQHPQAPPVPTAWDPAWGQCAPQNDYPAAPAKTHALDCAEGRAPEAVELQRDFLPVRRHAELDVRLLPDANLPPDARDDALREQRAEREEVLARLRQAPALARARLGARALVRDKAVARELAERLVRAAAAEARERRDERRGHHLVVAHADFDGRQRAELVARELAKEADIKAHSSLKRARERENGRERNTCRD